MNFVDTTALVYESVKSGELSIDDAGCVWRIAAQRGNRHKGGTHLVPCDRRRAETDGGRYLMVRTMIEWRRYHTGAHRLVWHHFFGPIPAGLTINHKNGTKHDNSPDNLELATMTEQRLHSIHVLNQRTTFQLATKLTDDDVRAIRLRASEPPTELAAEFGVRPNTVKNIIYGFDRTNIV